MIRPACRSIARRQAVLALLAAALGAGCGGNVVCDPGACTSDDSTGRGVTGEGGAPTSVGDSSDIPTGTENGGSGGGASVTGPALVYPYSFGGDLQVVRLSTEILDCAKLNWGMPEDDCDWWLLEIGIPASSFAPGSFPIDFSTFVSFSAAAANPGCIIQTGGGLFYSDNAVLTILEVSESSVSVELTGVSTEDLNGHDANGSYTALWCEPP
jgi:hypothetical protein